MTVNLEANTIFLRGDCEAADAEVLISLLSRGDVCAVDISVAARIHTAVIQMLIARAPRITGQSADAFFNEWIVPHLNRQTSP